MDKDYYIQIAETTFHESGQEMIIEQIENYFHSLNNYKLPKSMYKIGDEVILKKGTFMHGTYKNIEGLIEIADNGFIASQFSAGRLTKYPSSVGVWNLKNDISLKEYINFYSGGTIKYINDDGSGITEIIPYNKMNSLTNYITKNKDSHIWMMEQTKEVRYMPSHVQEKVQIAFIINTDNEYMIKNKEKDILSLNFDESKLDNFVNEKYYEQFLKDRNKKDDFFTNRESAIIFGFPPNFIEGVLVGRQYEKDSETLRIIKEKLFNCYICNLDGRVIRC